MNQSNQYCTEVPSSTCTGVDSEATLRGATIRGREERERGQLSPVPIKDRQAVDGGDQRPRETVGDCEHDRLERRRELLASLSQVVFSG